MLRISVKISITFAFVLLTASPSAAALYVVNKGSSANVAGTTIDLDGDSTNDFAYYNCGPTCPAIRSYNGWAYGNPSQTLTAWEDQTYDYASTTPYTIPSPDGGFGFTWNGGSPTYSSTYEVFLLRSSQNRYYKIRLTEIDTSDLTPATVEVVQLYAFPQGDLMASMSCSGSNLFINITQGDGAGTDGNIFRASASSGPGISTSPGANIPGGGFTITGPGTWTNVVVSELTGDLQALGLGSITCGSAVTGVDGDFNLNGKPDLLWRNYSTGAVNVWYLNGTTYTGGASLFSVGESAWRIEGTGEFNGDGKTDLIWRNYTTGAVNVWYLNGTTYMGGANLFAVGDPNWEIEVVGDFNGDGKDDLIWRNYASGAVNAWFMNGASYLSGASLFTVADTNWKIEVAGDFNGDGEQDLIWRNYSTGAVNVWFLNGTSYLGGASLFTVADANWRIEAVGDYNGDGKLDLIWRNYGSGAVNVWFLNGTTYLGGASLFNVPGASWEIAGPR